MTNSSGPERIRLNKLMAMRGMASRREADRLIQQGLVRINGKTIDEPGVRVEDNAHIELKPEGVRQQLSRQTILINKPVGYVSAQAEGHYKPAVRLLTKVNYSAKSGYQRVDWNSLAPAGRLDIDSEGLLVLTNDGRIASRIIAPDSPVDKEYLVRFKGTLRPPQFALLQHGLSLDGKPLKPCKVEHINAEQLRMTLKEGRKRQIRRMLNAVDLEVLKLQRVRIGAVRLASLPVGKWRFLAESERF